MNKKFKNSFLRTENREFGRNGKTNLKVKRIKVL